MQDTADVQPFDPADYRGRNALVLLFAPSARSPVYEQQMEVLMGEDDRLRAYDMLLVRLFYEGESYVGDQRIDKASALRLRREQGVADDGFCLVLIDREGRRLRTTDTPMKPEALYDALDAGQPS